MAEDDFRGTARTFGQFEPGREMACVPRCAFFIEAQAAIGLAKPQSRKAVRDETQTFESVQGRIPATRRISVHRFQKSGEFVAHEHSCHFARVIDGIVHGPGGRQARVNHSESEFGISVNQRLSPEPVEQLLTIGSREDLIQRVFWAWPLARDISACEQVEIVISQHRHGPIAERDDFPHDGKRFRAAINQVAGQPEPVMSGVETSGFQKPHEFAVAALDVTDGVGCQWT